MKPSFDHFGDIFPPLTAKCDVTLIFNHDLHSVKINQRAKYLDESLHVFRSKVNVRTHWWRLGVAVTTMDVSSKLHRAGYFWDE